MPSRSRKKVLVSIPTAQYAERLKLEGVLRFAHDILARRALAAAEERGIAIPADMAVLGVDDDEVIRRLSLAEAENLLSRDILECPRAAD